MTASPRLSDQPDANMEVDRRPERQQREDERPPRAPRRSPWAIGPWMMRPITTPPTEAARRGYDRQQQPVARARVGTRVGEQPADQPEVERTLFGFAVRRPTRRTCARTDEAWVWLRPSAIRRRGASMRRQRRGVEKRSNRFHLPFAGDADRTVPYPRGHPTLCTFSKPSKTNRRSPTCRPSRSATACACTRKSSRATRNASSFSPASSSAARAPGSTKTSRSAAFPTARASNAFSRFIRPASPRSRLKRQGTARRAKLNYLRGRKGKQAMAVREAK